MVNEKGEAVFSVRSYWVVLEPPVYAKVTLESVSVSAKGDFTKLQL
jgi:hypothetical protein